MYDLLSIYSSQGYKPFVINIIYVVAFISAVFVIVTKNPIISVLFLIALFLSVASYLMLIGLEFLGLAYLLVYVGAISILFLFILMLINIRISELSSEASKIIPLALFISVSFNFLAENILPFSFINENVVQNSSKNMVSYFFDVNSYLYVTSNSWDTNLNEISHISNLGNIMYSNYFIWLFMVSIILLLAMIGAILITLNKANTK